MGLFWSGTFRGTLWTVGATFLWAQKGQDQRYYCDSGGRPKAGKSDLDDAHTSNTVWGEAHVWRLGFGRPGWTRLGTGATTYTDWTSRSTLVFLRFAQTASYLETGQRRLNHKYCHFDWTRFGTEDCVGHRGARGRETKDVFCLDPDGWLVRIVLIRCRKLRHNGCELRKNDGYRYSERTMLICSAGFLSNYLHGLANGCPLNSKRTKQWKK